MLVQFRPVLSPRLTPPSKALAQSRFGVKGKGLPDDAEPLQPEPPSTGHTNGVDYTARNEINERFIEQIGELPDPDTVTGIIEGVSDPFPVDPPDKGDVKNN